MGAQIWKLEPDGEVHYDPEFLVGEEAWDLFRNLEASVRFEEGAIRIAGKTHKQPRLIAWMGDKDYAYSGFRPKRLPFSPKILDLKIKIETLARTRFNGLLINFYRDGRDSVGWHADNERSLGLHPTIASVSLGGVRLFKLRPRSRKGAGLDLRLAHGSLLLMRGALQAHWEHCLPKTAKAVGGRLNLTFRNIKS